jgi:hypothetical protein
MLSTPSSFLQEIDADLIDDNSLLGNTHSLDDGDVTYVSEDEPFYSKPKKPFKPGSFLQNIDDL